MRFSCVAICFSVILLASDRSNAACPELSKLGDHVDLAFRGGPLLRGRSGTIRLTREADGITAVDASSSTMIDGDRFVGPFLVSEGNRYRIWQYDRDIKQVLANFPPGTAHLQASINIEGQKPVRFPVDYKTSGESEFAVGACAYHVYKIEKTIVREDEHGVYFSTELFAPKLGFYVRAELQSGDIGKALSAPRLLYEITGFSSNIDDPK